MKRFSKLLALTLLLALVVSVFAVLPTFAAEDATTVTGIKTVYDFDSAYSDKTSVSMSVSTANKIVKNEDGSWSWTYDGVTSPTGDNYLNIIGSEQIAFLDSPIYDTDITLKDGTVVTKTAGTGVSRNTKYLVIDLDLNWGDSPIDFNINARLTNAVSPNYNSRYTISGANYTVGANLGSNNTHPKFRVSAFGQTYLSNGSNANVSYSPVDTGSKWHHVTLIYDTSGEYDADGNIDTSHWAIHGYIDGVYAGMIADLNNTTARLWFLRWGDDSTSGATNFANLTVTRFGTDYNGMLDDGNVIGNAGITLADIPELAYCLEDVPAGSDVIAKVTNANGDVTEYTDLIKLDSALQLGDTIELFANINKALIVPDDGVEGTVGVTVVDNGFTAPTFIEVDASATDYVVRHLGTGAVISSGKQSYSWTKIVTSTTNTFIEGDETKMTQTVQVVKTNMLTDEVISDTSTSSEVERTTESEEGTTKETTYASTDAIMDAAYANRSSDVIITFFNDVTITSSSSGSVAPRSNMYFDLNGNFCTIAPSASHMMSLDYSNSPRIVFRDGEIKYNPYNSDYNLLMTGQSGCLYSAIRFEDISYFRINKGVLVDQRQGVIYFKNCNISAAYTVVSSKSGNGLKSKVILDNTTLDANAEVFSIRNVGNSYHSLVNYFTVKNGSDIKITGENSFLTIDAFFNASATANKNYANVRITDSKISVGHRIVDVYMDTVGEGMTYNVDIDVDNSTLTSYGVVLVNSFIESNLPESYEFGATLDVTGNSELYIYDGEYAVTRITDAISKVSVYLEDGTKLHNPRLHRPDCVTTNLDVTLGDDTSVIAGTSADENYPYVVTPVANTQTVSYTPYGETEAVTGYWVTGETPVASTLAALPEASATTAYRYVLDENGVYVAEAIPAFPLKTNLTLSESITINVYIPTTVGELDVVGLTLDTVAYDGEAEIVTIDEVEYYKVAIKGITPKNASTPHTVSVTVKDVNDKALTFDKTISVVDYLDKVYSDANTTEADKSFIATIFTYIVNAAAYGENGVEITAPEGSSLTAGAPTGKEYTEATEEIGLAVSLNLEDGYRWIIEELAVGEEVTVTYNHNGETVTRTLTADANGKISFAVKACDLLDTVTVGEKSFTFENYAAELVKTADDATKTLINAIYDYAAAAAGYKAN